MTVGVDRGARAQRRWYREPLVWMLLAIPLASVVMGVILLAVSIASYDGLVEDDYYRRGLEINRSLERDRRAAALGLGGEARVAGARVEVALAGGPSFVAPPVIALRLMHATRAGLDRRLRLPRTPEGHYAAATRALEPGRWYLQVEQGEWRLTGLLAAPGEARARLGVAGAGGAP